MSWTAIGAAFTPGRTPVGVTSSTKAVIWRATIGTARTVAGATIGIAATPAASGIYGRATVGSANT